MSHDMTKYAASESTLVANARGSRRSALFGVTAILSGTMIGQVATFFALPILSRLYSPEQFGVLAMISSLCAISLPVALLRLDGASVLPADDRDVAPLMVASAVALAVVAVLLAVMVGFTSLGDSSREGGTGFLVWAVPATLILMGTMSFLSALAVRSRHYSRVASRNTIQSLGITASQLAFAPPHHILPMNGLVLGTISGSALGTAALSPYGRRYWRRCHVAEPWEAVRKYWRFPTIFAPTAALTLAAQQGPILLATYCFTTSAAGQVAMAERIVAVPLALVGTAIGTVFEGEMSRKIRDGRSGKMRLYLRTSGMLALVGTLLGAGLFILAPTLFPSLLGDDWHEAAIIAQMMALVAATRVVLNPTRRILQLLERATATLCLEVARISLFAGIVAVSLHLSLSMLNTLAATFTAMAMMDILVWLYGLLALRRVEAQDLVDLRRLGYENPASN